jgi:hypothetical protein
MRTTLHHLAVICIAMCWTLPPKLCVFRMEFSPWLTWQFPSIACSIKHVWLWLWYNYTLIHKKGNKTECKNNLGLGEKHSWISFMIPFNLISYGQGAIITTRFLTTSNIFVTLKLSADTYWLLMYVLDGCLTKKWRLLLLQVLFCNPPNKSN